ncbi:Torsin-1A-interacting protein 2 [Frankliniella fusca]|uniref:Torsin-1A-interacting protein 2 n=1 Tax=Frankliniella fusca TaxID=407009 RepID=A0AAE1HXA9_9NEOP|nr:Torsin-1A-interacting protein 2 [Frankliniella fusca]
MEPTPSPESSPIKSPCPSLPSQSPVSSPIVSVVSSPIRSIQSSPVRSVPSSPYVEVSESPYLSQASQLDFFNGQVKRQRLDCMETNQASYFPGLSNVDHCRQLFTNENLKESVASKDQDLATNQAQTCNLEMKMQVLTTATMGME